MLNELMTNGFAAFVVFTLLGRQPETMVEAIAPNPIAAQIRSDFLIACFPVCGIIANAPLTLQA
jgi:hypothetical protein